MRSVTFLNPKRLVFGCDCLRQFSEDYRSSGYERLLVVTAPPILLLLATLIAELRDANIDVSIDESIEAEPSIEDLQRVLAVAGKANIDSVVGIGGGSILDVAKLVAALYKNNQKIHAVLGSGYLNGRATYLACLPTTSGTGSEVSPNAILIDPVDNQKKGVISPFLVPDGAYVDPVLTKTVPSNVTAATGMDALTHCIEAYANKFAHLVSDLFALEGIRLIASNLKLAVDNGDDLEARSNLALGSLYGGMCLGPVNTAAVHALAYPLGTEFHVAHGLSNAVLLPYVMEFNLVASPERYARIAVALGMQKEGSDIELAAAGIERIRRLCADCGIPTQLSSLGIPETAIDKMAEDALAIERLLKNNLRQVTLQDAKEIYLRAF